MDKFVGFFLNNWYLTPLVVVLLMLFLTKWYRIFGMVSISKDSMGLINKKFATKNLENGHIIAVNGEAGNQAMVLSPGIKFGYFPWQFDIIPADLIEISQGFVGIVTAIDGEPMTPGRILGRHVECNLFQDAVAFLRNGGQRGPQLDILPPGKYRINTLLFEVEDIEALQVPPNQMAIITTLDGNPLPTGDIAGREVTNHSSFQNAHAFIERGGCRGLQEQILLSGTYYVNSAFLSWEFIDLTEVPIGSVGVVISYVGKPGVDQSGDAFTHGNIVAKGERGVWAIPLDPGRYAINTRVMRVEKVITTNTVLNWITGYNESHGLDKGLESIEVRSKDGFSFPIEVSQIIHISANNASKVIARFGTVVGLVSQVLEPTIDNYFRNAAQDADFLEFLSNRSERQTAAGIFIKEALKNLDVEAVDTLIGDIKPPEALMSTLTSRKIATEEIITFGTQQKSQETRATFEEARSMADTRKQVVEAQRSAEVAKLHADAEVFRATGEANAKKINAEADANVLKIIGEAEAGKKKVIGTSEAEVLKMKVDALGQGNYTKMEILNQLAANKTPLVPRVLVSGGENDKSGIVNALMGTLLAKEED